MLKYVLRCVVATLLVVAGVASTRAARTVILDTTGSWRMHHTLKPPVVQTAKGLETILSVNQPWFHEATPEPPEDWMQPDFDDSAWLRGPMRLAADAPMVSRLCLRGKFRVTDPRKVKDLRLTLGYYGGAVVYVNGVEIKRGHMQPGDAGRNGLAEMYPKSVYLIPQPTSWGWLVKERYVWEKKRTRRFTDLVIPRKLLKTGLNVLAIEVIRAVENPVVDVRSKRGDRRFRRRRTFFELKWPMCSARWAHLTAAGADGIVPNATRPKGMQVWNSDLLAADFDQDFGDPTEPVRPVRIAGARNGSFSGKVVVGSDKPLKHLRADLGPLVGPGVIAPTSVRIRYGFPWGTDADAHWRYILPVSHLGALTEKPPTDVPVSSHVLHRVYGLKVPHTVTPAQGAVRSVWVTVDVPTHAAPGLYKGTLTIRAKGEKAIRVPVEFTLEDWTLPDTDDYITWVELMQSTDTLALEYKVRPWSERHWQLIAQSMKHLNRIGSRILYIPVICHTNLGNDESMVRWIEKPDGTYDWDFSLMDRYLETARVHMGKPKVVCLWVWEKFMFPTVEDPTTFERYWPNRTPTRKAEGAAEYVGRGPKVTVLDRATGKTENKHLPYLLDAKSRGIWKPLFEKIQQRMKARGLADTVMLGTPSDVVLRQEHFDFFKAVAPGLTWVNHSHADLQALYKSRGAKLGYYTTVFGGNIFPEYPDKGRRYGWQRKELQAYLLRNWYRSWDQFPVTSYRHLGEVNIAGNQRGIGHLGADFWSVVRDKRDNRRGRVYMRYPEGNWRSNDICTSLLAPGPEGPVATHRYEVMREGIQECEARIFIERALTDARLRRKLGVDLARRAQELLDERIRFMLKGMSKLTVDSNVSGRATNGVSSWWNSPGINGHKWFIASGWQERTRRLFATAGEVAGKLERK